MVRNLVLLFALFSGILSQDPAGEDHGGVDAVEALGPEESNYELQEKRREMYRYHGIGLDEPRIHDSPLTSSHQYAGNKLRRRRKLTVSEDSLPLPGKRGIGFTLAPEGSNHGQTTWTVNLPKILAAKPYWCYSWNHKIEDFPLESILGNGIEWVPMVFKAWGKEALKRVVDESILPRYEAGIVKRLLGYNEPDHEGHGNMPVSLVASTWPVLETVRESGMPLASPAIAMNFETYQHKWINHIHSHGSKMDYIAIHWYGTPIPYLFKKEITELYELYGGKIPIMITEFAPVDWNAKEVEKNSWSRAQVLAFMKQVLPWLESQEWIVGYAWFSFNPTWAHGTCSSLFDLDGNPTELGLYYASVTTENPHGDKSIQVVSSS